MGKHIKLELTMNSHWRASFAKIRCNFTEFQRTSTMLQMFSNPVLVKFEK
jgi:hypothetical protein